MGFPGGSVVKNMRANARASGDACLILGSGRSHGGGNSNPPQYSCLENPMDRGAWWATVHGVTKSQTQLSEHTRITRCCSSVSKSCPTACTVERQASLFFTISRSLHKLMYWVGDATQLTHPLWSTTSYNSISSLRKESTWSFLFFLSK